MWFTVDFDQKTYDMLMSHSPEAGVEYLKKRQDYLASLPSVTGTEEVKVEIVEEIKEVVVEDAELAELQAKYKEVTGKNLSPAYKSNKEWILAKIEEATPKEEPVVEEVVE